MSIRLFLRTVFLFLIALVPAVARAQQGDATVRGTVTDPDQAVIPGATVTLTPAKGAAKVVQSGADGSYVVRNVPAGTYSLTVTMDGFATFVRQGVRVAAGQALTMDAKMALQMANQEVQVNAESTQLSVDQDSNASTTTIKGKDLDALSDDPDELSSELSALAGPAAGPNGGQIYVDGFTGGQLPPKSSIREVRINQNPFSAQYDRLGYGRVEVFTKPGTDKFHGNFNIQGNTKPFNTSNPFLGPSNNQPDYHTIFMLGSISGPINHRTSFTVSGSHRNIDDNSIVNPSGFYAKSATDTVPCAPGDLTCTYFPSYPEAARAVPHPSTRSDISPRVDFALGEKNTLTVRYQYEVSGSQNNGIQNTNLPATGYNSESTEHTVQVSDTQILSARVINETRFEYQRDYSTQDPLSTAPALSVQGIFTYGGSSLGTQRSTTTHFEGQNYTSIALSKNFIRFGGRIRTNSEDVTSTQNQNGTFFYSYLLDPCTDPNLTSRPSTCKPTNTPCDKVNSALSSYQCGLPGQYTVATINQPTVHGRGVDVGLYAEDDWKVKPNLTISYGIRYEAQNIIHSNHDFAPRLSFAWGVPHGKGSPITVIRGGYGMFYDRFSLDNYITTLQQNGFAQMKSTYINPGATCTPANPTGCGTAAASRISVTQIGQNTRSSYTMQAAVGVDQQLGRIGTISVNYLNARGVHEYMTRNYFDPGSNSPYAFQFQSAGVFRQNQLLINSNIRLRRATLFGFYSINFANANTSGATFIPTSNTNTKVDYGRATFAQRQFGVVGGSFQLPYSFTASPFIIARAGVPYNITSGLDPTGSSVYNARPYFANGSSGDCFNSQDFSATQTGSLTPVPINYCTGPANATINLRIARIFGFGERTGSAAPGGGGQGNRGGSGGGRGGPGGGGGGARGGFGGGPFGSGGSSGHRYTMTLGAQVSNLFNMVPYATPTSTLTSQRFGEFTALAPRPFSNGTAVRAISLQASFNF
ncbi:TonB-dependent receptor [Edaphobacter aggregans]|uniref:TonB-dependent receptor n=1 Tax=Edaphobacter aggregans TaxID=570835 RepID=UPI000550F290|nr:carboxypeptidase-like regulatory domain-containing protein [Edaphobacter aggregans]